MSKQDKVYETRPGDGEYVTEWRRITPDKAGLEVWAGGMTDEYRKALTVDRDSLFPSKPRYLEGYEYNPVSDLLNTLKRFLQWAKRTVKSIPTKSKAGTR